MTLIRPFTRNGKQMVHMITGKAEPAREWVEIGYEKSGMHPSVELVLDGTIEHYLDNVPAQHYSMVYGDYAVEVGHLCHILNIELIYEK